MTRPSSTTIICMVVASEIANEIEDEIPSCLANVITYRIATE